MRVWVRNREAVAMALRQHIESGHAQPGARRTLHKIQVSRYSTIDLNEREIDALLDLFNDIASDYYWTPMEYVTDAPHKPQHERSWRHGPTRQLSTSELEEFAQELEEG